MGSLTETSTIVQNKNAGLPTDYALDTKDSSTNLKTDLTDTPTKSDKQHSNTSTHTEDEYRGNWVSDFQDSIVSGCKSNSTWIIRIVLLSLFILYTAYFTYALIHSAEGSTTLIAITGVVVFVVVYGKIRDNFGDVISEKVIEPVGGFLSKHFGTIRWYYPSSVLINHILCIISSNNKN